MPLSQDPEDAELMNLVDDVVDDVLQNRSDEEHVGRTTAVRIPLRSQSETASAESSDEGSVIEAIPSKKPSINAYEWVGHVPRAALQVRVPVPTRRWEFRTYDDRLKRIVEEVERDGGELSYIVQQRDGRRVEISYEDLIRLPTGKALLNAQAANVESDAESTADSAQSSDMPQLRTRTATKVKRNFIDLAQLGSSDDELETPGVLARARKSQQTQNSYSRDQETSTEEDEEEDDDDDDDDLRPRRRLGRARDAKSRQQAKPTRQTRVTNKPKVSYNYGPALSDDEPDRRRRQSSLGKRKRAELIDDADVRRSGRQRYTKTMREVGENEIGEIEVQQSAGPAARGATEVFKRLSPQDEFRKRHCMTCDTCSIMGSHPEKGELIHCQSCTASYHRKCLGHRTNREHLVTKVDEEYSVLQCRRCLEVPRTKDKTAPHHGRCSSCKKPGSASRPFRPRKTPADEQREREANDGQDPIYSVRSELISNVENVLFRCTKCFQAFHFHHLPSKQDNPMESDQFSQKASHRFAEYSETWECHECEDRPVFPHAPTKKGTPGTLIAWRPLPTANYISGQTVDQVDEDDKEYLVKWQQMSHYKCMWKSGPWVWGVAPSSMRRAFAAKENNLPTMNTEDAVPEDWLRIDIIFSVKYNNYVQAKIEEVDIARIKEVGRVYVKFKGLGYEDAVWTDPPDQEEAERYEDFRAAYVDYVRGQYIRMPTAKRLQNEVQRLRPVGIDEKALQLAFEKKTLLKEQPAELSGGKLMDYQLDGVNWMLFKWLQEQNAVLADEMGLGKTIQVVGFLTALKENHNMCPFLIVVPNATCANWRREIKQWAPSLRVVTYFGSAKAKELSMEYELFGDRSDNPTRTTPAANELRCHVVVTSYDAAADPENQQFFKRINWQALIVDEGQRLKNDKTNLYSSLLALKAPFRLLLTGTPLQNNQRELFNLLAFLDRKVNAEALEKEYENLDDTLVKKLHEMIRPYFLRRTKAQVLDFLPPMGQIIVPITMTKLQRELYKNILSKNAELVKAVMGKRTADKGKAISGLKNVLMQLRKVLCHPFVYSIDVEERTTNAAVSHRRLVAASAKLVLLEVMLPKLWERGHRVLLFSQFLDNLTMIEDFLDGMQLPHLRLDGTQGSLEKQKAIDKFNAPNSEVFCMLLSTRAGGVGINLATADTVIILDPDFNPHQDIQAISRAHRIGQQNKVLVFKLMTRDSAEERIMQVGKKKMVLDHVIIDQMEEEGDGNDLSSILAYGAKALFEDDTTDINYDDASIDKLLDRSAIENTKESEEDTQETQFSFARIWKNDAGDMGDQLQDGGREGSADSALWDSILAHRQQEAEAEMKRKETMLGRGRRARNMVNYGQDVNHQKDDDSDTDFADKDGGESDDDRGSQMSGVEDTDGVRQEATDLSTQAKPAPPRAGGLASQPYQNHMVASGSMGPPKSKPKPVSHTRTFRRSEVKPPRQAPSDPGQLPCLICKNQYGAHVIGDCPIKKAKPEYCNLCGLSHFGYQRTCPHLQSETQVRLMLEALKHSQEDPDLVRLARMKLQGIKGTIVQKKKKRLEQLPQQRGGAVPQLDGFSSSAAASAHTHAPLGDIDLNRQGGIFTPGWSPMSGPAASAEPPRQYQNQRISYSAEWQRPAAPQSPHQRQYPAPGGYTPWNAQNGR